MSRLASARGKASRSSSAIVVDRAAGYHDLKIDACSLDGVGGLLLTSCTFTVGGRRWRIRYYPDGDCPESAGFVSLFLALDEEDVAEPVTAQFKFTVVVEKRALCFLRWRNEVLPAWGAHAVSPPATRAGGTPSSPGGSRSPCCCVFTTATASRSGAASSSSAGSARWRRRRRPGLPRRSPCPRPTCTGTSASSSSPDAAPTWCSGSAARRSPRTGALLPACGSAVLRCAIDVITWVLTVDKLFGAMMEGGAGAVVQVDDMEALAFKALLCFVYTDSLPQEMRKEEEDVMYQHLLVAADRYDLKRLKLICEDKLCKRIGVDTVETILALAEQHHCDALKKACLDFRSAPTNQLRSK
ncbi:hypothetical protein ACP70R_021267 [Stipagrostis hirtigluma subsp. patula]